LAGTIPTQLRSEQGGYPMFKDRAEAGKLLAEELGPLDPDHTVVLALPRGGVPVAAEICKIIGAPLDLVLVRKIGAPAQPELAVGAIVDGVPPAIVVNRDVARVLGLSREQIERLGALELPELRRRRERYLSGRDPLPLAGDTAVLVDDGVATGATARAAIAALKHQQPTRIIFAVPVAPLETIAQLRAIVDDAICLQTPSPFISVGEHYERFEQVTDDEVIALLDAHQPKTKSG
jgi:putative phosphoribosyl transferase